MISNVFYPKADEAIKKETGKKINLGSHNHLFDLTEAVKNNDVEKACMQICLEMERTAKTVRNFYDMNYHLTPGKIFTDFLQQAVRVLTEIHYLAHTSGPHTPSMYSLEPQNLNDLIQKTTQQYPQVSVDIPTTETLPCVVVPRAHATFVITELVKNSIQESDPNKQIQIATSLCPYDPNTTVLSVTNFGRKPFRSGEDECYGRANPNRLGSTGVGLPISRAICDIFGKGLELKSLPDDDDLFRTVAKARFYN